MYQALWDWLVLNASTLLYGGTAVGLLLPVAWSSHIIQLGRSPATLPESGNA